MICLRVVVPTAVSALSAMRTSAATAAELARLDALLLLAAGKATQPLLPVEPTSSSITGAAQPAVGIACIDTDGTKAFQLHQADELVLQVGDETHRFSLLSLVSVEFAARPIPHLSVIVRDAAGEVTELVVPIGRVPLPMIRDQRPLQ